MEVVKGHQRVSEKGHVFHVSKYDRKSKPKKHTGIHKAFERKFDVIYYQDDQGRLVSKRKYKKL